MVPVVVSGSVVDPDPKGSEFSFQDLDPNNWSRNFMV